MTTFRIPLPVLLLTSLSFAIPWPVAPTNQTHSLLHSYGDYHRKWDSIEDVNFHYGIDIADPNPLSSEYEPVRCVEAGVVQRVQEPGTVGWFAIIEDNGTPSIDGDGWIYEHIQGLPPSPNDSILPRPCRVNDPFSVGDIIGYIAHVYQPVSPYGRILDHLHLMRADEPQNGWEFWHSGHPASLNPLFYLNPAPTSANGFDWSWSCDASLNPTLPTPAYMFFILPQYEALGSGGDSWLKWADAAACKAEANGMDLQALSGPIDLFLYFYTLGEGDNGGVSINKSMPQRLHWWIERKLADNTWTNIMADNNPYHRYLFDFGDIELGSSDDADKYKQLYFRFSPGDMGISNGGYLCCLTNVSDNQAFNGVSNIDEKCWDTSVNLAGTGTAVSSDDALFPDGEYRIRWEASAFDGTATGAVVTPEELASSNHIDVRLENFEPITCSATINDAATDAVYWDAGWEVVETTNGYEMQFVVNTDESTYPTGQTVDVEIHFSESMNPNSTPAPTIMLEVETGYCPQLSGSWSGTTVDNDTWTGTAVLPVMMVPGRVTLLVSCQDMSGEWLENPANPGVPFMDNYHGVDIAFGVEDGWPEAVRDEVMGSPKLADIDQDGDLDVVIQSADGWVDVLDDDGSSMSGWPVSGGWSTGNPDVWASPAIVNLSGVSSSAPEILAVHPSGCNGYMATGTAISSWSGILPSLYNWSALSSPVAGNFNNTGNNEYVLGRQREQGEINPTNLLARENDGSAFWLTSWGEDESVSSTPSLADVDNDGNLEVIAVSDYMSFNENTTYGTVHCVNATTGVDEWNTFVGGTLVFGGVATANLDLDSNLEIVVGATSGSNSIKVLDGSSGSIQYSIPTSGAIYAGASIADIDADGDNDIVVSCADGLLYCWDGPTGNSLSGFPVSLGTWTADGVSIGDIDSDDNLELVIAGRDGKLHVINHDGSSTGGFPVTVSGNALSGQPALGDIDGDGKLEIVFGEAGSSVVHCYEMADNSAYTYLPWPQFQHDAQNTGCFITDDTAPGAPSRLGETHTWSGDVLRVNLSWTASSDDPGDVISYRVYRQIFNEPTVEMIGTVNAGTTTYQDRFVVYPWYAVVRYHVTAWDGLNESAESNGARIRFDDGMILSSDCSVREIIHSAAIGTSSSSAVTGTTPRSSSIAIGTGSSSSSVTESRTDCRILTDGNYDAIYTPSGSSDCIEIDLGAVFSVSGVDVIRADQSHTDSHRYELSVDGRSFSSTDTGRARYVRVYNPAGATEIEVIGADIEGTSALIEIQRSTDNSYRIVAVESGTPITATVFDLSGRSIWSSTSSTGEILWNRCNSSGNTVPNGVYLIMVESDEMETFTSKVIVR